MSQLDTDKRAGIICHNNNNVLLVLGGNPNNLKLGFPKGHLHKNETYKDCAIRETYEETGIVFTENDMINSTELVIDDIVFFIIDKYIDPGQLHSMNNIEIADTKLISIDTLINHFKNTRFINKSLRYWISFYEINNVIIGRMGNEMCVW